MLWPCSVYINILEYKYIIVSEINIQILNKLRTFSKISVTFTKLAYYIHVCRVWITASARVYTYCYKLCNTDNTKPSWSNYWTMCVQFGHNLNYWKIILWETSLIVFGWCKHLEKVRMFTVLLYTAPLGFVHLIHCKLLQTGILWCNLSQRERGSC